MLAVVICLSGSRAKQAADFLQGKDCQVVIAVGPNHVAEAIQVVESKSKSPAILLTDSVECLMKHAISSAYGPRHQSVFWGDDPEGRAKHATIRLPESANLGDVAHILRRLASGVPFRPNDPDLADRLRRL